MAANYRRLKLACYATNLCMSVSGNLSPLMLAGVFYLLITVPLTLICSIPMLLDSIKTYKARDVEAEKAANAAAPNSPKEKILAFVRKYCPAFFGIFGILCLQYLGLIPMVFLLVLGWMKLINHFSWPKSVLIAGIVTVVIFLIFDVWLQIPFPGLI